MILSPLEQFEIISLLPIQLFCFDFSVTNLLLISILTLIIFSNMVYFLIIIPLVMSLEEEYNNVAKEYKKNID